MIVLLLAAAIGMAGVLEAAQSRPPRPRRPAPRASAPAQPPAPQAPEPAETAAPAPAPAQAAEPQIALTRAGRLHCSFTAYAATRFVEGAAPETVTGTDTLEFDLDTFDVKQHTARLVGSTASVRVTAFWTDVGLNVIEQTPIGNFILTTVFEAGRTGNRLLAVHSRHIGDITAPPSPSQYFGSCEIVR